MLDKGGPVTSLLSNEKTKKQNFNVFSSQRRMPFNENSSIQLLCQKKETISIKHRIYLRYKASTHISWWEFCPETANSDVGSSGMLCKESSTKAETKRMCGNKPGEEGEQVCEVNNMKAQKQGRIGSA